MSDFTHLHVHTQYSILDGAAKIKQLIAKAKSLDMKALAITDHGNMYGTLEFFNEAKCQGIKPIIGCEMYVAEGSRFEKKGREDRSGFHLILLAKNKIGYQNLARLSSMGFKKDSFYYTPRIDKELLKKYSEGLIASTACLGGEVPYYILNNGVERAAQTIQEYIDIFGEDFYLELQNHGIPEQKKVNIAMQELAQRFGIKCIATNDVHFINANDSEPHHILICLNTGRDFDDPTAMHYTGQEYLKSQEEMQELFAQYPESITNTQEIVDKIEDYKLKRDVILPVFPLPDGFDTEMEYLRHLSFKGAEKKYPEVTEEVKSRLDFELSVIESMGFPGYFLIVQDFINKAREMDVMVGPGRGSAAGSVVAFSIGITNIDPIKYNLLFERFLNPERVSMPDIDIDFDDEGRDRVLKYVVEKYGEDKVAQIVTFGTMAAKSSIRDVARVLKLPLSESDRLAKLVPEAAGMNLEKAFHEVKELEDARKNGDALVKKTLEFAHILEGSARHTGTHACGVIIGPDDLMNYIPLSTSKDSDLMVSQYEGTLIESVGMLKMDFLGLKTLSIIKSAIVNIYKRHNVKIDIDTIPLDDTLTFELYQKGDTIGTFQFESDGMRGYLKDLKPTNIEDLIAMNALYRPGPMQFIQTFINRKLGKEKAEYPHAMLEEILKPTHGIMVYQEQIMQTAQLMGGYSLGRADVLRRAMGKKKLEAMKAEQQEFVAGAVKQGIDEKKANETFEIMEKFAQYGFNRSHSAAYSLVAYQTAYLKAHYPAEYMAAVLTHNLNDLKKITFFIDECNRSKIPVLGPCINESVMNFTVNKKGEIRFGMAAIKGVGEAAVFAIIEDRDKNGFYKNIFDLAKRVNLKAVNKRSLEALAYAGAFDTFEDTHRAQYFYQEKPEDVNFLEKVVRHASQYQNGLNSSQHSLFGESEETEVQDPPMPEIAAWSRVEQLKKEKEIAGFYLSGHPLDDFKLEIQNFCNIELEQLNEDIKNLRGRDLKFAGIISSVSHRTTKTGKPMGSFTIEDFNGSHNLALFSDDYLKFKHFLIEGASIFVKAIIKNRFNSDDQFEIKINHITLLVEVIEKYTNKVTLRLPLAEVTPSFIESIKTKIKKHKGKCKLIVQIIDPSEKMYINLFARNTSIDAAEFAKAFNDNKEISFKLE
ncbi:MAG: DNA polymerase III subunit alpha [Bacteroidales bacterium]